MLLLGWRRVGERLLHKYMQGMKAIPGGMRLIIRDVLAAKYEIARSVLQRWKRIYLEEGAGRLYIERRGHASAASGYKRDVLISLIRMKILLFNPVTVIY